MTERRIQLTRPVSEEERQAASRKWSYDKSRLPGDLEVFGHKALVNGRVWLSDIVRLIDIDEDRATISVGREDGIRIMMVLVPAIERKNILSMKAESLIQRLRGFFSSMGRDSGQARMTVE